jgi:hypothetical protein
MPDRTITLPAVQIDLADGEHYAGLILTADGTPSHHLVLLPDDHDDTTWQASMDWAKSINGELPSRTEQSLLYANCKPQFKGDWYWSGELHASDARYAWFQDFGDGGQGSGLVHHHCRARAVRRLPI